MSQAPHAAGLLFSRLASLVVTAAVVVLSACGPAAPASPAATTAAPTAKPAAPAAAAAAPTPGAAAPTPAGAAAAAGTTNPTPGGSMTIINGSDIRSWDPALTLGTFPGGPMDALDAVYGFLVYVDVNGAVTGSMAQSLTSSDGITWTLKLRDGINFTDGTPYDAAAVKFNWDRTADPATAAPTQAWIGTWKDGMSVADPTTLIIKLPSADADFASKIAHLAPFIASPEALRAAATKTDIKAVGAGPFLLQSWDQGVSMTLTRNPAYWDQPRPYLETLKFVIIPETNSRIATVVQGGAQMMAGYPYQFGTNASAPGVGKIEIPISGINRGHFNQASGIFTDLRARQAFWYGIDRTKLMQAFTQTDLFPAPTTYFAPNSPYYDESLTFPSYDPAKAQSLIDALAADGKQFNIKLVSSNNSDVKRLDEYIQQTLSSYKGVTVTLSQVDDGQVPVVCGQQHAFDVCVEGGVLVANGAQPVTSDLMRSTGVNNYGQYKSSAMDEALAAASATVDTAKAKAAYQRVQQLMLQDLPIYVFGRQTRYLLVRDNTGGVVPSNGGILQKQFLFVCPQACVK
jgi:peptide/nickel transport system substrate-binding protein